MTLEDGFLIRREELDLRLDRRVGARALSYDRAGLPHSEWRRQARRKLADLLGITAPRLGPVRALRQVAHEGVLVRALLMQADDSLSLPAYLLVPQTTQPRASTVLAIHGHGEVEPCLGLQDDYHHRFALELAKDGHTVLCPELRGFGLLSDLAAGSKGRRLDYWGGQGQFSLVTDGFLHGRTLLGETVEDLLRWEEWLAAELHATRLAVAGISYGGDLALTYPAFSSRVSRIFASGSLGSFEPVFDRCYNAPAHCVPGVLAWMDRADIAGLNAPRPLMVHYGELDVPSDTNFSAAYNETVAPALRALRAIYAAAGAPDSVRLVVSPGRGHEMDLVALRAFLEPS